MTHKELNAWIVLRKGEGLWVTRCAGPCGLWFAQKRKTKRATFCGLQLCEMWRVYRGRYGRAAPQWMVLRWLDKYGDSDRKAHTRPKEERVYLEANARGAEGAEAFVIASDPAHVLRRAQDDTATAIPQGGAA